MNVKSMLLANSLLSVAGGYETIRLNHALKHPRQSAEKTLRSVLRYAENTVYGKEHDFSYIQEAQDDTELYRRFREKVPANTYEDLRPYVERQKHGEPGVLIPGRPVMYATTSGTTSEPKWIPISTKYLRDIYGKMTRVWLYNSIHQRPKAFSGKILAVVGKLIEGYAPDGTIFGSVSGVTRIDCPPFIKALFSNPTCVYNIEEYNARYYVLMRMAIETDVTMVGTPNPSTIQELLANAEKFFDDYIADIEAGTISDKFEVSADIRKELAPMLHPNPGRAAQLRALKEQYGHPLPRHYWPNLQILSTWKCGNTAVYIDKFKEIFPENIFHQELGYFSSECRFGVVLDDTIDTQLFPHFHFYEFIEEAEIGKPNPHFLLPHELVPGKRYCPFVTTFSGLYRYNMNDLVEAGPVRFATPTVHMVQKVNGIVSITGEKLAESQFIKAVQEAERETGLKTRFFVGFADLKTLGYQFYYEFINPSAVSEEKMQEFNARVDAILQKHNVEYESKRSSHRLSMPVAHRLVTNAFRQFKRECLKEGYRPVQFKMLLLLQDEYRHEKFKRLIKE